VFLQATLYTRTLEISLHGTFQTILVFGGVHLILKDGRTFKSVSRGTAIRVYIGSTRISTKNDTILDYL